MRTPLITTHGQLLLCVSMLAAGCASEPGELRFGIMLMQTLVLLVGVCGLALLTLRLAARAGLGRSAPKPEARMEVVEELSIGPRQSILALRAGSRVWLIARAPTGLSALGDMPQEAWRSPSQTRPQHDDTPQQGPPASGGLSFARALAAAQALPPPDRDASSNGFSYAELHAPTNLSESDHGRTDLSEEGEVIL